MTSQPGRRGGGGGEIEVSGILGRKVELSPKPKIHVADLAIFGSKKY